MYLYVSYELLGKYMGKCSKWSNQPFCRPPQYIPQKQLTTLPQVERPIYLPELSVDQGQPQKFESQQQLHAKYLLQPRQSRNCYSQCQPNYGYLVTSSPQQNRFIGDQSSQNQRISLAPLPISCLDGLVPNPTRVPLISEQP